MFLNLNFLSIIYAVTITARGHFQSVILASQEDPSFENTISLLNIKAFFLYSALLGTLVFFGVVEFFIGFL